MEMYQLCIVLVLLRVVSGNVPLTFGTMTGIKGHADSVK